MELVKPGKKLAARSLVFQCIFALILASMFFLFKDVSAAIVVFCGGTISILANMVFAFFAFRFGGGSKNKEVVKSFKKGSKLKFFSTVALFVIFYQWPFFHSIDLFLGYCLTLLAQYLALIYFSRAPKTLG